MYYLKKKKFFYLARFSEMILSGNEGGIYKPILSFIWLWSRLCAWQRSSWTELVLCSASHKGKPTFVHHVGYRREQLTTPWEVISHGFGENAFELENHPEITKSNPGHVPVCLVRA